jgi:hypothetical protein
LKILNFWNQTQQKRENKIYTQNCELGLDAKNKIDATEKQNES